MKTNILKTNILNSLVQRFDALQASINPHKMGVDETQKHHHDATGLQGSINRETKAVNTHPLARLSRFNERALTVLATFVNYQAGLKNKNTIIKPSR